MMKKFYYVMVALGVAVLCPSTWGMDQSQKYNDELKKKKEELAKTYPDAAAERKQQKMDRHLENKIIANRNNNFCTLI